MENTTQVEPEQMESGKWYVVFTKDLFTEWLIKFDSIQENRKVIVSKCYDLTDNYDWTSPCNSSLSNKHDIKSIRPATNEEVLKYFPDEKFENVSLINEVNNTQITEQQNKIESEKVEVDWKAKFEELQKRYEVLVTEAHKLDVLSGEMCDKYTALKASYERLSIYNDELTEKINETETKNNQEKVYIHYNSKKEKWLQADTLELALDQSEENKNIYEAVKIGVKKSILVNENS